MSRYLTYMTAPQFLSQGYGTVRIGQAPDALPLLLTLRPPPTAESLLHPAAQALGRRTGHGGFEDTPLEGIARQLDGLLGQAMRYELARGDLPALRVRILPLGVRKLTGATLIERLLGSQPGGQVTPASFHDGPSWNPPPGTEPAMEAHTGVGSFLTPEEMKQAMREAHSQAGLGLPLDGDHAPVILRQLHDERGWPQYEYRANMVEERCRGLEDTYLVEQSGYGNAGASRLHIEQLDEYRRRRASQAHIPWHWSVPRISLARWIEKLCERLAGHHKMGEVHGDLKPANLLAASTGPVPIDSLELRTGARSTALTQGWAAPEQLLLRPVSPQTDQYALGLMLLELVGGVVFGEETRVAIPSGGRKLEYHKLFRDPGIFIDPSKSPVPAEHLESWRDLIERCLRFEPEERFESTEALQHAIGELVRAPTVTGNLEVPLRFGQLVQARRQDAPNGPLEACWLIDG